MSLDNLLESLHSRTVQEKGRAFERLCRWFLVNDPRYKLQVKKVWLFGEWPNRWGADTGTDLIVETYDGKVWAIQAKAYGRDQSVTKRGIDSFLSDTNREGIDYRLLIATTNHIAPNARKTMAAQTIPVGVLRLSDLKKSEAPWPESLDQLKAIKRETKKPREHQQTAIDKTIAGFGDHDRGQLIMACGAGKTLTCLWLSEAMKTQRTLVLVPSLSLLSQTLTEWAASCAEPFAYLPVCSDSTVGDKDQMTAAVSELGVPATTDTDEIVDFLSRPGRRVVFSTYQSSTRIAEAFKAADLPPFDLAIADEAHRCAGKVSADFGTILDGDAIPCSHRLFTTATPRVFTGRVKKVAKEAEHEIASMDDVDTFGPVFHQLNFSDAIELKLLSDYQVVVMGIDDETCREYLEEGRLVSVADGEVETDANTLAAHVAVAKAMKRYNLSRIISFHSRVKKADKFSENFPKVVAWMPEDFQPSGTLWTSHVSGAMSTGKRDELLDRFRELEDGERGLMSNARCLSEGVDVPSLDGVAFVEPRKSQVDIVQAVGRAIRKAKDKEKGTIIIPVYLADTDDPETVLDTSKFKPVWDICKALRSHDDVLAEELDTFRRALGREGKEALQLPDKIVLDMPAGLSAEFAANIELRIIESATGSWEFWKGLCERFRNREKHMEPEAKWSEDGFPLGQWVSTQRYLYRKRALTSQRVSELEGIDGWCWDPAEKQWSTAFERTSAFAEAAGHTRVPSGFEPHRPSLPLWIQHQRSLYRQGKLGAKKTDLLSSIKGWAWDPRTDEWNVALSHLLIFQKREGHLLVPAKHVEDDFNLGNWVSNQRASWKKGNLDPKRVKDLEHVPGWTWDIRTQQWDIAFRLLADFVDTYGHSGVPSETVVGDIKLGRWVVSQRRKHKTGNLESDYAAKLSALPGWAWDSNEASWNQRFLLLKKYCLTTRSSDIPSSLVYENVKLGAWTAGLRSAYRSGKLRGDRIDLLESLPGWAWEKQKKLVWEQNYSQLENVLATNEQGTPLSTLPFGPRLQRWKNKQRAKQKKGQLSATQIDLLEKLPGWKW